MVNLVKNKNFSPIYYLAGFYLGEISTFYKHYTILTDSLIFVILYATVYQLLASPSEHKESLSVSFVVCISYSLSLYYSLCFRLQHNKISHLFSLLDRTKLSLFESIGNDPVRKSCEADIKLNNIYVRFGIFAAFMSAFLFSVQPLLRSSALFGMDGSKRLQINIWCPFDLHTPLMFEVIVLIQFCTVFWVALRFFANDSFYMCLIKQNIRFFSNLTLFGENVMNPKWNQGSNVHKTKKKRVTSNSLYLHLLQDVPEDISDVMNVNMSLHKDFSVKFDIEFNKLAEEKLKLFIKCHQLILRCGQQTCQLYGPVMLMYLISLMGFASVGAFGVMHTSGFEGVQSIAVTFFSIANLIGMYFMCEAGDELSQQSGDMSVAFAGSPWYVCSKKFRSSLVLVLQRVNTRVQACVIGTPSMPLTCNTFAWVPRVGCAVDHQLYGMTSRGQEIVCTDYLRTLHRKH